MPFRVSHSTLFNPSYTDNDCFPPPSSSYLSASVCLHRRNSRMLHSLAPRLLSLYAAAAVSPTCHRGPVHSPFQTVQPRFCISANPMPGTHTKFFHGPHRTQFIERSYAPTNTSPLSFCHLISFPTTSLCSLRFCIPHPLYTEGLSLMRRAPLQHPTDRWSLPVVLVSRQALLFFVAFPCTSRKPALPWNRFSLEHVSLVDSTALLYTHISPFFCLCLFRKHIQLPRR